MRLRNKNWTKDFIKENNVKMISWDGDNMIDLKSIFRNDKPVYLEIGCGKGNFVSQNALNNPNINFIGMEKEETVVGVALKKTIAQFKENNREMVNIKFLNKFAEKLTDMFEMNSISRIYLNFSDPWPKAKHYKKRLTYIDFLNIYRDLLVENGEIHMKTDNDNLFKFTIEQIYESREWNIINSTTDLYKSSEMLENNIPTEYETKFHKLGKNINKIIFSKK